MIVLPIISLAMDHWISSLIASLMDEAMKMTSSQSVILDQFHMNVSYMITLSYFMYILKLRWQCSSVNLHGWLNVTCQLKCFWNFLNFYLIWPIFFGCLKIKKLKKIEKDLNNNKNCTYRSCMNYDGGDYKNCWQIKLPSSKIVESLE